MQHGFQLAVKNKSEFRLALGNSLYLYIYIHIHTYVYTYIHTYIQNYLVAAHNSARPGIVIIVLGIARD